MRIIRLGQASCTEKFNPFYYSCLRKGFYTEKEEDYAKKNFKGKGLIRWNVNSFVIKYAVIEVLWTIKEGGGVFGIMQEEEIWREIETERNDGGFRTVKLKGRAKKRVEELSEHKGYLFHVSVTREIDTSVAFVALEGGG